MLIFIIIDFIMIVLESEYEIINKSIEPYLKQYNCTPTYHKATPSDDISTILTSLSSTLLSTETVLLIPGTTIVDSTTIVSLACSHCVHHSTVSMLLATNPDTVIPPPGTAITSYVWTAANSDRTVVALDPATGRVLYYAPSVNFNRDYNESIYVKRRFLRSQKGCGGMLTMKSSYEDVGVYIVSSNALKFLFEKQKRGNSLADTFIKHLVRAQFNDKMISEFHRICNEYNPLLKSQNGATSSSSTNASSNQTKSTTTNDTTTSSPSVTNTSTTSTTTSTTTAATSGTGGNSENASKSANGNNNLYAGTGSGSTTLETYINTFAIPSPYAYTHTAGVAPKPIMCSAIVVPDVGNGSNATCARMSNIARYYEINKAIAKGTAAYLPWEPVEKDKFIAPSAKVDTVVSPESIVGENSEIMERSSCRKTIIGRNCSIGKYAKVTNSIIMDGVTIGDNVQVSDSIVCAGVTITLQEGLSKAEAGSGITGSIIGHGNKLVLSGPIKESVRMLGDDDEEVYEEVEEFVEDDDDEVEIEEDE